MSYFQHAYDKTIGFEGGYSNVAADRGGETYKGISRVNFPNWGGWSIIDDMKLKVEKNSLDKSLSQNDYLYKHVEAFYLENFWNPLNLTSFDQDVADELFDTAVNQGLTTAAKYLQQALNLLNNAEKHYSNIKVDGQIGANTIKAYNAYMLTANFPGRNYTKNISTLVKALNGLQFQRYMQICATNEGQEIFLYGWLNRV